MRPDNSGQGLDFLSYTETPQEEERALEENVGDKINLIKDWPNAQYEVNRTQLRLHLFRRETKRDTEGSDKIVIERG